MKVVDESGNELPTGSVGELWVKGPSVVKGYWQNPEATAETFIDGWLRTGDIARLDEEGFCTILDRAKDMLIRGGENIYCVEVENALYEHPGVIDAAVASRITRSARSRQRSWCSRTAPSSARPSCAPSLPSGWPRSKYVPVKIVFAPSALPRNPTGKLMKRELKKLFADKTA